jgi:hypothetical protein
MIFRYSLIILLTANIGFVSAQRRMISSFDPIDPTNAVNKAFRSDLDTIVFDSHYPTWTLKPIRLVAVKDKTILFESGVKIKAEKGFYPKKTDALFKFIDCSNIKLLGSKNVLSMNKEDYIDGEWRHVIRFRGCMDMEVRDLELRDSGGDGLTIGRSEKRLYSQNIIVSGIVCDNNKRQGISIVSGKNILVENSIFKNTVGTFPGAGVDLEPDREDEFLQKIEFKSCAFIGNYNAGIKIASGKLTGSSEPISINFKDCIIENNFSPENPKVKGEIVILTHKSNPVNGEVQFENCIVRDSKWRFLFARKSGDSFTVNFLNCQVQNINQQEVGPAIYLEVPHYSEPSTIGGFNIKNLSLDSENLDSFIAIRGSGRGSLQKVNDISATVKLEKHAEIPLISYKNYNSTRNENVKITLIN